MADIAADGQFEWFSRYLAADLMLGDPAARDAAIHAVQACIPHARLLPIGVEKIVPGRLDATDTWSVHAKEQYRDGDLFVYDLSIVAHDGTCLERWEGLRLKKVEAIAHSGPWSEALLGPYLERRLQELVSGSHVSVSLLHRNGHDRRTAGDLAVQDALGGDEETISIHRRPDGKPQLNGDRSVSISHGERLTMAVAGSGALGCDVEAVRARPEQSWRDLLGRERFELCCLIGKQSGEDLDTAATRVWTACEWPTTWASRACT